jgi:hypothetical protein
MHQGPELQRKLPHELGIFHPIEERPGAIDPRLMIFKNDPSISRAPSLGMDSKKNKREG